MIFNLNFKLWFESGLRDILKPVPQSPIHHAEGDTFIHSRMVRKQLDDAIVFFQQMTLDKGSVFGDINPEITKSDRNLLRIAAWMHDIGKASATTVDKKPWEKGMEILPNAKIQAIGHENPEHFEKMMQNLGKPWTTMYENASEEDKEVLWYIIKNHMSLKDYFKDSSGNIDWNQTGFSKKILSQLMDANGKFKNDRKTKLLLILIMMDQSGRISPGEPSGKAALPDIAHRMSVNKLKPVQVKQSINDPQAFIDDMKKRGKPPEIIKMAFSSKFKNENPENYNFD